MTDTPAHGHLYELVGALDPTWQAPDTRPHRSQRIDLAIPWENAGTARDLISAAPFAVPQHTRNTIAVVTRDGQIRATTPMPLTELARISASAAITIDIRLRSGIPIDHDAAIAHTSVRSALAAADSWDSGQGPRVVRAIDHLATTHLDYPQFGGPVVTDPTIELLATLLLDAAPIFGDVASSTSTITGVFRSLAITLETYPDLLDVARAETALTSRTVTTRPASGSARSRA